MRTHLCLRWLSARCQPRLGAPSELKNRQLQSGCVSGRDLPLDFAPQGAVGDVEIIAGLQINPELRRRAEVAAEAHSSVGRYSAPSEYNVIGPRSEAAR